MSRLTSKVNNNNDYGVAFKTNKGAHLKYTSEAVEDVKDLIDKCNAIIQKLGALEDIEEESGITKTGSSLLAFLQTPYIKSILNLYVSARKEFREDFGLDEEE